MNLNHNCDPLGSGVTHTHGSRSDLAWGRFGGAYRDGTVSRHHWVPVKGDRTDRELVTLPRLKFATYRKAQRKLRQWLKGYTI